MLEAHGLVLKLSEDGQSTEGQAAHQATSPHAGECIFLPGLGHAV